MSGPEEVGGWLFPHFCLGSHVAEFRDRSLGVLLRHAVGNHGGHLCGQTGQVIVAVVPSGSAQVYPA